MDALPPTTPTVQDRHRPHVRSRWRCLLAAAAVVPIGLASRAWTGAWPWWVGDVAGDALWATMVFLVIGFARPGMSAGALAVVAWLLAASVELTQLYRAPWLDAWRATLAGQLLLGQTFVWADLAWYALGVGLGVTLDRTCLSVGARGRPDAAASR